MAKFRAGQQVKFLTNPFEAYLLKVNVIGLIGEIHEAPALKNGKPVFGAVIVKVNTPEHGVIYLYVDERDIRPI